MANHHDHHDHHSDEKKPVSFTVPLIFASVVVLAIVLLVSLGDPKPGCCEGKEHCEKGEATEHCEKGCKENCEHEKGEGHEAAAEEAHAEVKDSTAAEAHAAPTGSAAETTEPTAEPAKSEHH